MAGGHGQPAGAAGRIKQLFVIAGLVVVMCLLHWIAGGGGGGGDASFDPTGMLAFGFIVLASYTIGQLVEAIKLPHITGYLLAGVAFGYSITEFLPETWNLAAPFDRGVLNPAVIGQLGIFDSLAVALIALTAGGELKIETLKKGLKAITGILGGQLLTVLLSTVLFIWVVGGAFPSLLLPGMPALPDGAVLPVGCMLAAIAFATSPAATIAVINGSNADGPMSRTTLSAVVLKDVIVVVMFSIASVVSLAYFSDEASSGSELLSYLLTHIVGSILVGVVIGGMMALYVRYSGQELLLFLVGVIYTATLIATMAHLDPVLIFLAAGFTVSNFSKRGEELIHTVEQLSMPVYVIFFTLAGARLHLDELVALAPYAVALVALRVIAIWLGSSWGAAIGKAEPMTRRYGWMGFVSQAGVALSLGAIVGERFGETGAALQTLILAAVAINELIGPVMLKVSLGLAGEEGARGQAEEEEGAKPEAARPSAERLSVPDWPTDDESLEAWGPPPAHRSPEIRRALQDLESSLRQQAITVQRGPLTDFQHSARRYLRELRREYLRHSRRLSVVARDGEASDFSSSLQRELGELSERWRTIVLTRAARLEQRAWTPDELVQSVDELVRSMPARLPAEYEASAFSGDARDSLTQSIGRFFLRVRRGWYRLGGSKLPPREVLIRDLAHYHLSGKMPTELEGVAALLVYGDYHLASRTRGIFDQIARHHASLSRRCRADEVDLESEVRDFRAELDQSFALAFEEAERMGSDAQRRTTSVLAKPMRLIKEEIDLFGTVDLPFRARRPSRVFRDRVKALDALSLQLTELRRRGGGGYSVLALELELAGLMARVEDAVNTHVGKLMQDVRGRGFIQAGRVEEALSEAAQHMEDEIGTDHSGEVLSVGLRRIADQAERTVSDAARNTSMLHEQMVDERTISPLLDALSRAARRLTDEYEVVPNAGAPGEWKLPPLGEVQVLPFRARVAEEIETVIASDLVEALRSLSKKVQPLTSTMQEFSRLIAFNTEIAQGELDVVHEEMVPAETQELLREMVVGGLERDLVRIEGLSLDAKGWDEELGKELRQAVIGNLELLRERLVAGDFSRADLDARKRELKQERLRRGLGELPQELARAAGQVGAAIGGLIGAERLESWRRALGLPAPEVVPSASRDGLQPPRTIDGIPLIYLRLFSADTIEASDVLTGRGEDISRAQDVLMGQSNGRLRSVALVGIDGVGKSAMISAIVRFGSWKQVHRLSFEKPMGREDLKESLKGIGEGQLVVLSGVHWLISARPGGFAPLRDLVEAIISDGGRNAFLMHMDSVGWEYATRVAPLADAFPSVFRLDPLSCEDLEDAVMKRHRLSDFDHLFEPQTVSSPVESWLIRGAGRLKSAKDRYFRLLHESSGGLVRDALRLWLASVLSVDEDIRQVHIGPVPNSAFGDLLRLPNEVALTLYQVARQGWMDTQTLSHLFRVNATTAEAQLARLVHLGLLTQTDDHYQIPVHLRGAVVRMLQQRGWA